MKYFVSGIVNGWRTETWISAPSLNVAIKLFESMHSGAKNVYVLDQE
jgi:hypothetical protein